MRAILFFIISAIPLLGQTPTRLISPRDRANAYATRDPFLIFTSEASSVRYQQVYGSSDFQRDGNSQWWLTEISFQAGLAAMDFTLPNVQIALSTTQRQPDGLSSIFAENIGADNMLVYSGELIVTGSGSFGDIVRIQLEQPFLYDANAGSLLLDVRNFQTIAWPGFEPVFGGYGTVGDTVSLAVALDVNSPTALLGTGGLFTEFTAIPVPEPRLLLLLPCALALFGVAACFRRVSVDQPKEGNPNVFTR